MSTSTPTATVHALKPNTAAYFVAEAGEAKARRDVEDWIEQPYKLR